MNIGVTKAGTDKEDNLVEEVNQTVAIGEALGVSNIGNFINQGLRKEHDVGFVLFQESGYANVSESILESYWGYRDFGFDLVEPVGRSGGIVRFGAVCNIINVYAPQRDVDKRLLWSELAALINSKVGLWVVAGDFNSVRSAEERRNSFFNHKAATEFNCFIEDTGLQELSLKGSKFTFSTALMNKFKALRQAITRWKEDLKTKEMEEENVLRDDIDLLEKVLEERDLSEEEQWILEER
ncbi:RNA-directed DNA polymerase, eukaryota [Artemisia annua]|uniref:RNA-directed DNA polymerase, eukaryota n=1 Tax=Artemisia annua TaxID=35608 RepID=A0A2U1MN74_ARTAN|nr:RNA-directed DNA polymerase, eukaryota [Artemisia annua]